MVNLGRVSEFIVSNLERMLKRINKGESTNKLDAIAELDKGPVLLSLSTFFRESLGEQALPVRIAQSSLPNAGLGLFATRRIPQNSPICFYPGWYFPPPPPTLLLNADGSHKPICSFLREHDNPYLLYLPYTGGFLDAKEYPTKNPAFSGHFANHPPPGVVPNMWTFEFLWRELEFDIQDILHLIPNTLTELPWYVDENGKLVYCELGAIRMPGVAFLAFRDIEPDEEIFFDYGMSTGPKVFPWYSHVKYPPPKTRKRI